MALDCGVESGQIYRHARFYRDDGGDFRPKYLLILAISPSDDIIFRPLTSRQHGRPKNPRCYHGDPCPGFYLGRLQEPISQETWIDLRAMEDYEGGAFQAGVDAEVIQRIAEIHRALLVEVLDCAASAEDTTRFQESLIRDQRAAIASS